jgi:hypothetical protein
VSSSALEIASPLGTSPLFDLQVPFGPAIADWAYGEKIATMTIELHGVKIFLV